MVTQTTPTHGVPAFPDGAIPPAVLAGACVLQERRRRAALRAWEEAMLRDALAVLGLSIVFADGAR